MTTTDRLGSDTSSDPATGSASTRSSEGDAKGAGSRNRPRMPSEVTPDVGWFDKFAGGASHLASRAPFFAFCVLLVIVWAPSYFILHDLDTWQLIINTLTTIVTFLMVALLQNSQYRTDEATQHKLNAIADGLADLMAYVAKGEEDEAKLQQDLIELRQAVGLEDHESST